MHRLPYILFVVVFFIPFLSVRLGVLPGAARLVFELVSGGVFLASLAYCSYHKIFSVGVRYIVLFLIVCVLFFIGGVVNSVDPATAFSGLRNYLKYTPLFLLPLVYAYSEEQMKGQLKFLLGLGLLQFPVVVFQKFVFLTPSDWVAGTLVIGSIMSIYLVCCVVMLVGLYFRGFLKDKLLLLLVPLLFIPTMLNESKGTLVLMFFGLLVVMLAAGLKKSHIIASVSVLVATLSIFTLVYNISFSEDAGKSDLVTFFTDMDKGIGWYLYSGDSVEVDPDHVLGEKTDVIGASPSFDAEEVRDRIRRIDAIVLPLRVLSDDPVKLLLGLGIGNASESSLKNFGFEGEYSFLARLNISMPLLPMLLWEVGVLGVFLYLLFFCFIYRDARYLAKKGDFSGGIALGWIGVVVILALSFPYKNFLLFEVLGALFFYLSGYIVSKRYRVNVEEGKLWRRNDQF